MGSVLWIRAASKPVRERLSNVESASRATPKIPKSSGVSNYARISRRRKLNNLSEALRPKAQKVDRTARDRSVVRESESKGVHSRPGSGFRMGGMKENSAQGHEKGLPRSRVKPFHQGMEQLPAFVFSAGAGLAAVSFSMRRISSASVPGLHLAHVRSSAFARPRNVKVAALL